MSENNKLRVGITHGDPNGIGYEVILKALEDTRLLDLCTPILYGSGKIVSAVRKQLEMPQIPFQTLREDNESVKEGQYGLVNVVGEDFHLTPGKDTPEGGQAALAALEMAMKDFEEGKIDVLVTAPINKHNIRSEEFSFPGHTEYLASKRDESGKELMILATDDIRVALATTHLPVAEVAGAITTDSLVSKITALDNSLRRDFGIVRPRIAVLGLNPHAGDSGVIGEEEKNIIIPAIEQAAANKIQAYGPYAADGFFGNRMYRNFDGVLAMYHDQGLIPFKTIAMDSGVNITAGLSIVRTSPDHGTAYDIAGKGEASAESMRNAIYSAIDIYRNRLRYADMTANPLRKQYFDKGKDNVVLDLR